MLDDVGRVVGGGQSSWRPVSGTYGRNLGSQKFKFYLPLPLCDDFQRRSLCTLAPLHSEPGRGLPGVHCVCSTHSPLLSVWKWEEGRKEEGLARCCGWQGR